jgi:hypothetical protein
MSYSGTYFAPAPEDRSKRCATCRHLRQVEGESPPHDLQCSRPVHSRGWVTRDWGCPDHAPDATEAP